MEYAKLQDKCRGSLAGGAVGDALGYPVEFENSFETIRAKYDDNGIMGYDYSYEWLDEKQFKALISDDTQMSLYTAEGLVEADKSGKPIMSLITDAYLAWFSHQVGKDVKIGYDSKLDRIPVLNVCRAPGKTCLMALNDINEGREVHNFSKGCGGIMRIAPTAVYGARHGWNPEKTGSIAGEAVEITHKHMMSTFASALQALIIQNCVLSETPYTVSEFKDVVEDGLARLPKMYPGHESLYEEFSRLIRKAIHLEDNMLRDWEIIENGLRGGWVAEETLAIAIFSVLRHIDDFKDCVICAVNHGGDSDSTGAAAGNIIGAMLGYNAIPKEFTKSLQLHNLIVGMADNLASS